MPLEGGPRCLTCGYDLTGLAADGVCPECGLNIFVSLHRDHAPLERAHPRTLRRMVWGATIVMIAGVGVAASSLILGDLFSRPTLVIAGLPEWTVYAGLVLSIVAHAVGAWFLATPDDRHVTPVHTGAATRATAATLLAALTLVCAGQLAGGTESLIAGVALVFLVATASHAIASILLIRKLGRLAGSETLAEAAGVVVVLAPLLTLACFPSRGFGLAFAALAISGLAWALRSRTRELLQRAA
jgi:hypothetical protein